MAAMYTQYPSQQVVSVGYPQQVSQQMMSVGYPQQVRQLPPQQYQPVVRGQNGGVTFCCCCHDVSPDSVRLINFILAGVLLVYAVFSFITLIVLEACPEKSTSGLCESKKILIFFLLNNPAILVSGKSMSMVVVLAFFGAVIFYIIPGVLMIVATLKSLQPCAFVAITLLGITLVVVVIIAVLLASAAVLAGPFILYAGAYILLAVVNYSVIIPLLVVTICANLATVEVINAKERMMANAGVGGVVVATSNMMEPQQPNVMSQVGPAQSFVQSNVMDQNVVSPS